jgi:hypothetical protein
MPGWKPAVGPNSQFLAGPIAWPEPAQRIQRAATLKRAKGTERFFSRQFSPGEIPREAIESQVGENVSGNCLPDVLRINQPAFAANADLFVPFQVENMSCWS